MSKQRAKPCRRSSRRHFAGDGSSGPLESSRSALNTKVGSEGTADIRLPLGTVNSRKGGAKQAFWLVKRVPHQRRETPQTDAFPANIPIRAAKTVGFTNVAQHAAKQSVTWSSLTELTERLTAANPILYEWFEWLAGRSEKADPTGQVESTSDWGGNTYGTEGSKL